MIDGLPTLSAGAHEPGDGKACVMEYVALLAGESWTDSPACTHPVLARAAQRVNDGLPDDERHLLVPLIGRLFGTAESGSDHERRVLSVRLAVWCARQVMRPGDDASRRAIEAAEGWCEGRVTAQECQAAAAAAYAAAYTADAAYAAAYAATATAALLTGLLDEYDRLTGRTEHRHVSDTELRALAAAI